MSSSTVEQEYEKMVKEVEAKEKEIVNAIEAWISSLKSDADKAFLNIIVEKSSDYEKLTYVRSLHYRLKVLKIALSFKHKHEKQKQPEEIAEEAPNRVQCLLNTVYLKVRTTFLPF